jgi:hypothetical protein
MNSFFATRLFPGLQFRELVGAENPNAEDFAAIVSGKQNPVFPLQRSRQYDAIGLIADLRAWREAQAGVIDGDDWVLDDGELSEFCVRRERTPGQRRAGLHGADQGCEKKRESVHGLIARRREMVSKITIR